MQRGSAEIFLAIGILVVGLLGLKMTDLDYFWAAIVVAMILGCHGAISVSERARA
jgi:TctA family transporter